MTNPITIQIDEPPQSISEQCGNVAELLHFYLHAGDMVAFLRDKMCDNSHLDDPVQFYALISVLDEALNASRKSSTSDAIDFLETLSSAFYRETASYKDVIHATVA